MILQEPLQSTLQITLQRKLQQDLQGSYIITSTTIATATTSPLTVYSRESEQYISVRKLPVHVF